MRLTPLTGTIQVTGDEHSKSIEGCAFEANARCISQPIRWAEVLPTASVPLKVPSAIRIPPSAGRVPLVGRVSVKGVCSVDCLCLGPERVLKSARDQKCRSKIGLERKPTPQTPFTMPFEAAFPAVLLSGRRDLDTGSCSFGSWVPFCLHRKFPLQQFGD
jgi:hypothetical protein